jgi:hypothetical protein
LEHQTNNQPSQENDIQNKQNKRKQKTAIPSLPHHLCSFASLLSPRQHNQKDFRIVYRYMSVSPQNSSCLEAVTNQQQQVTKLATLGSFPLPWWAEGVGVLTATQLLAMVCRSKKDNLYFVTLAIYSSSKCRTP